MFAVAGGILLVIFLPFILTFVVEMGILVFWLLIGAGAIVCFIFIINEPGGFLPLLGVVVIFGGIFFFLMFMGRNYKTDNSGSSNNLKSESRVKEQILAIAPKSRQLEIQNKIAEIIPAFKEIAQIRKIQKINAIKDKQKSYGTICIKNAALDVENEAVKIFNFLNLALGKYLTSDLMSLELQNEATSCYLKVCNGISILVILAGKETTHLEILVRSRPLSAEKQQRTMSVFFQELGRKDIHQISERRLLRIIKKDLIRMIKQNPELAKTISIS